MRKAVRLAAAAALIALPALLGAVGTSEAAASVTAQEWSLYKQKFLDPSGRIIDNANGSISHSEGQGYGLLLAYLADNRGDFDIIWAFTRTQMLLRNDGLAVWKWDPKASPHVSDTNNATDGDLLIAYAMASAGSAWNRADLTAAAFSIADSLAKTGTKVWAGATILKPGSEGFDETARKDGPVVNPSYYIFDALDLLAGLRPDGPWTKLAADGLQLVKASMLIGVADLPPDWVSLADKPAAADGFPKEFGYNAVRVPLYLVRAKSSDRQLLERLRDKMRAPDGSVRIVDVMSGKTRETLDDPGFRVIPALIDCVLDSKPLPDDLATFTPTDYYPSSLHLLALSFARLNHPDCL